MGQLGLHESYANQFLPTSRLILNSILCRGSCGSYYAHTQCGLSAPLKFAPLTSDLRSRPVEKDLSLASVRATSARRRHVL